MKTLFACAGRAVCALAVGLLTGALAQKGLQVCGASQQAVDTLSNIAWWTGTVMGFSAPDIVRAAGRRLGLSSGPGL